MDYNFQFYLKEAIKRLRGAVLLNMMGLSLGLTIIILISTWVRHELSYDKFHLNSERIFRVESLVDFTGDPFVWSVAPAPVAEAAKIDFPEVENSVNLYSGYSDALKVGEEVFIPESMYYTSSSFFKIFSYKLISGSADKVLNDPYSIVISLSEALRLYGDTNPIGETILLKDKDILTITGVMEDFPSNSHLKADYLVSWALLKENNKKLNNWDQYDYYTYFLLKEGVDADKFNKKLGLYIKTKDEGSHGILFLNPIERIYLYRDPGLSSFNYPTDTPGPIGRVRLFGLIGLVILTIAIINFVNLSTAYASVRAKEIGIRKVNGASRIGLITQLFGESVMQTIISILLAIALAALVMPLFIKLSGKDLGLQVLFSWESILIYAGLTLVTAIVAGFYPAFVLSSYKPIRVFRSSYGEKFQGVSFRKILVLVQFALATIFIFCILVIGYQLRFMQEKELGFDKESVMVIYPKLEIEKVELLASEVSKLPGVSKVAIGGSVPVNMGNWNSISKWEGNTENKSLKFHKMQVDDNYFDLLGFEMIEGRKLLEGAPRPELLINEAAVRQMGISNPIGKTIQFGRENGNMTIVGVIKDFHFREIGEEINPVIMYKSSDWWAARLFVKLDQGYNADLIDRISALVIENAPGFPARYIFLDEAIDSYFNDERRLSGLINMATILSIIISAIGLFSLTAFLVRKRYKEIGVRKVHGASSLKIMLLLNREFWILLLAATVVSMPLAYILINRWLDTYSYHVKVGPIIFVITLLLIVLISTLTISIHTIRAANLNPANTLRDE